MGSQGGVGGWSRRVAVILSASALAFTGACGDDEDEPGTPGSSSPGAEQAPAVAPTKADEVPPTEEPPDVAPTTTDPADPAGGSSLPSEEPTKGAGGNRDSGG